jgi:ParB/RepB/Spo0J family partition protein
MDQDELRDLPLEWLEPDPAQDRKDWESRGAEESMEELTESIRTLGVRRPIEVMKTGEKKYRVIAGERRFRAAEAAGLKKVPCIVRVRLESHAQSLDMLTENLNRRDLNPIELAEALQKRLDDGIPRDELLKAIGQKSPWLSKRLALLKIARDIQDIARRGLLRDIDTLTRLDKLKEPYRARLLASVEEGTFDRRMLDAAEMASTTTGSTHALLRDNYGSGSGGGVSAGSSSRSGGERAGGLFDTASANTPNASGAASPSAVGRNTASEGFSPQAAYHVLMTRGQMANLLTRITGEAHRYDMADLPSRFAEFLESLPSEDAS